MVCNNNNTTTTTNINTNNNMKCVYSVIDIHIFPVIKIK